MTAPFTDEALEAGVDDVKATAPSSQPAPRLPREFLRSAVTDGRGLS